jgi:hypothetical protein
VFCSRCACVAHKGYARDNDVLRRKPQSRKSIPKLAGAGPVGRIGYPASTLLYAELSKADGAQKKISFFLIGDLYKNAR